MIQAGGFNQQILSDELYSLPLNLRSMRESFLGDSIELCQVINKIENETFYIKMVMTLGISGLLLQLTPGFDRETEKQIESCLSEKEILVKEENLLSTLEKTVNFDYLDIFPFENLIYNHAEYFLKYLLAKFFTMIIKPEDRDNPEIRLSESPQPLADPLEVVIFGQRYKTVFYHKENDMFLMAFVNHETNE